MQYYENLSAHEKRITVLKAVRHSVAMENMPIPAEKLLKEIRQLEEEKIAQSTKKSIQKAGI